MINSNFKVLFKNQNKINKIIKILKSLYHNLIMNMNKIEIVIIFN